MQNRTQRSVRHLCFTERKETHNNCKADLTKAGKRLKPKTDEDVVRNNEGDKSDVVYDDNIFKDDFK